MKKVFLILILAVITAFADTVYMKSGAVINGSIVTQNNESVIIFSNGANYTLNRNDIAQVQAGNPQQQQMQQAPAQQQQYPQQQAQQNYQQYPAQQQQYQNQPYQQNPYGGGYQQPVNKEKTKGIILTAVGGGLLAFGVIGLPVGLGKTIKYAKFDEKKEYEGKWFFWNNNDNKIDSADSKTPGLGLLIAGGTSAVAGSIILSKGVKILKAQKQGQPYARFIPDDVYLGIDEDKFVRNHRYSARFSWAAF